MLPTPSPSTQSAAPASPSSELRIGDSPATSTPDLRTTASEISGAGASHEDSHTDSPALRSSPPPPPPSSADRHDLGREPEPPASAPAARKEPEDYAESHADRDHAPEHKAEARPSPAHTNDGARRQRASEPADPPVSPTSAYAGEPTSRPNTGRRGPSGTPAATAPHSSQPHAHHPHPPAAPHNTGSAPAPAATTETSEKAGGGFFKRMFGGGNKKPKDASEPTHVCMQKSRTTAFPVQL